MKFRKSPLLSYLTYKGRLNRSRYIFYHVILVVIMLFVLDLILTNGGSMASFVTVFGPVMAAVSILFTSRRLHDMNLPGWWAVIVYLLNFASGHLTQIYPVTGWGLGPLSLFCFMILFFKKGTSGPNRFGPDPLAPADAPEKETAHSKSES
jgi:uncharacterized membrane protein YhaH (DUF805 family)